MTGPEFTDDEIEVAITLAIKDRELSVVPSLIHLLALQNPARAQAVMDILKIGRLAGLDFS